MITERDEEVIGWGVSDPRFHRRAAAHLLGRRRSQEHYEVLCNAFAREDAEAIRPLLAELRAKSAAPRAAVTKFTPGRHYHVLTEKFTCLGEAIDYLRSQGFEFGKLYETWVYGPE